MPRWQSDDGNGVDLETCPGITRDRIDPSRRSLWRYAAAMAVPYEGAVTLGEGWTPLLPRSWKGVELLWKLEYVMPTGSFKDRGMTAMVSYLKLHGITDVLEDSSGNAGASLSTYAAAAGMRCRIMVPATASYPKIAQMAAHGADVVAVTGTRQDVADAALREASSMFYASHNRQPYFLEGTKTLAYELWEQLGFRLPDNVIVPVGYGANVLGCERGFAELMRAGETDRMPRIFGVQAANVSPLAQAFDEGLEDYKDIVPVPTLAEGIASQRPTRGRSILRAVRESGGRILSVGEDEIVAALRTLAGMGFYVEPTCASVGAALGHLLDAGDIRPGETTVAVLTGTGLKASEMIGKALGLSARTLDPLAARL
ncbi:MAG: threonine synthase [Rhodocyclaceae bacterium]|nr:threonine synthase [Rhodocyclaceae bacterium]MCA3073423.1 threonine synthase [Rhodocyclaceae bacterium]MCA3088547.1 threonine synthase [Rhodocyclaceae bacterium]MCA3092669.1 threonine synthase [Rhodocyclaceae bacterium]MCA3098544.1 threonine synthase [Rhodocyclaceae bacterium]